MQSFYNTVNIRIINKDFSFSIQLKKLTVSKCEGLRYTNNTTISDIFFSGLPTLPSLVLQLYTQV